MYLSYYIAFVSKLHIWEPLLITDVEKKRDRLWKLRTFRNTHCSDNLQEVHIYLHRALRKWEDGAYNIYNYSNTSIQSHAEGWDEISDCMQAWDCLQLNEIISKWHGKVFIIEWWKKPQIDGKYFYC